MPRELTRSLSAAAAAELGAPGRRGRHTGAEMHLDLVEGGL